MSNTQKRIISAACLITLLLLAIYFGIYSCLAFVLLLGIITIDEIFCNFLKKTRFAPAYFVSQSILIIPFLLINFYIIPPVFQEIILYGSLFINFILVIYLFFIDIKSMYLVNLSLKLPIISGLYILFPFIALAFIFQFQYWKIFLGALLLANFGMDTGAWFFGKKFGRKKLWPDVSPKKTVEGLIGGMITAGIVGSLFWAHFMRQNTPKFFFIFLFLGFVSQIGDLIQSKFKRQFNIKDSSSLIPGHGGVYDRIDSLIFVTPFYAIALRCFYF